MAEKTQSRRAAIQEDEESIEDYGFFGNVRCRTWTGTLAHKKILPFFMLMKYNEM